MGGLRPGNVGSWDETFRSSQHGAREAIRYILTLYRNSEPVDRPGRRESHRHNWNHICTCIVSDGVLRGGACEQGEHFSNLLSDNGGFDEGPDRRKAE